MSRRVSHASATAAALANRKVYSFTVYFVPTDLVELSWSLPPATRYETLHSIKERIRESKHIPLDEIRVMYQGREVQLEDFLDLEKSHPNVSTICLYFEWKTPAGACQYKINKLSSTTKEEMIKQLKELPNKFLDIHSISEVESKEQLAELDKFKTQILIYNLTDQKVNQTVILEGEELVPVRLLPDAGGVECRGRFIGQFRAASLEMMTAVNEYEADLAHTKQLLNDLPIALANNETTFNAYMDEHKENPRYDDIGPFAIERYRIQKEIAIQEKKLKELLSNPIEVDSTKFIWYTHQTSVILRFGLNLLDPIAEDVGLSTGPDMIQVFQLASMDSTLPQPIKSTIIHPTIV